MAHILKLNELIPFFTALARADRANGVWNNEFELKYIMNEEDGEVLFECEKGPFCKYCCIAYSCSKLLNEID